MVSAFGRDPLPIRPATNRAHFPQIIRIQSSEGTKRIEIDQNDKLLALFDKVSVCLGF